MQNTATTDCLYLTGVESAACRKNGIDNATILRYTRDS